MTLRTAVYGIFSLAAILLAGGVAFPGGAKGIWLDRAVPRFSANDLDGREVSLAGLLGRSRVVVLNFWGVRCQACIEEMPTLGDLSERLGPKGLQVVGVNTDGMGGEKIKETLPTIGVRPGYTLVCDPDFKIMDAYQVTAVPFTLVIRNDGKASYEHHGFAPGDEKALESAILNLMEAPGH
jgi:peroxiredoxin